MLGADRIDLVQDMDKRWALVNAVMSTPIPQNAGNLLLTYKSLACPGFCSVKLVTQSVSQLFS